MKLLDRPGEPPLCPADRPLFQHQENAILAQSSSDPGSRPAIVVSAGTGAGKTEAFLLPVLNDLMQHPRQPGQTGVRAILLYPMNALVNDQLDRLYRWLEDQQDLKLLHFTSETPEDERALKRGPNADKLVSSCRLMTRDAGRKNPPDLLITNYSMLEYMLCRPQDAPFFGRALRSMVLDEAHLYSGTLAAEICLLLRRVLLRCNVSSEDVLQIATSATLGGGEEDVRRFAASIFSKDPRLVRVFRGVPAQRQLGRAQAPEASAAAQPLDVSELERYQLLDAERNVLTNDLQTAALVRACLQPVVASSAIDCTDLDPHPAHILYRALFHAPVVAKLDAYFWEQRTRGVLPLSELAEHLWADHPGLPNPASRQQNTIALLQLCARARQHASDLPIVPHKLHLQVRAPGHFSACLDPACRGETAGFIAGGGTLCADLVESCPACDAATLTLAMCELCGEWALAAIEHDEVFTFASALDTTGLGGSVRHRTAP